MDPNFSSNPAEAFRATPIGFVGTQKPNWPNLPKKRQPKHGRKTKLTQPLGGRGGRTYRSR